MNTTNPRILHQADVLDVVNDEANFAKTGTSVIASPTAPSGTYVQAEAESAKDAIDDIRAALTAAGITA